MKKISIICCVCFILFLGNIKAYAAASNVPDVNVKVNGKIEAGQSIQIILDVSNIDSFYAGEVDFKYDNKVLSLTNIEKGDLITQKDINSWEAINKVDNDNGMLRYAFTCTGQINGFKGSGTFIKINGKILKNDDFHIKSVPFLSSPNDDNNLKLELCSRDSSNNIKELSYNYTGYSYSVKSGEATMYVPAASSSPSTGSNTSTTNGNGTTNTAGGSNSTANSLPNGNNTSSNNTSKSSNSKAPGTVNNSSASSGDKTINSSTSTSKKQNSQKYYVAVAGGIIAACILVAAGIILVRRKKRKQ